MSLSDGIFRKNNKRNQKVSQSVLDDLKWFLDLNYIPEDLEERATGILFDAEEEKLTAPIKSAAPEDLPMPMGRPYARRSERSDACGSLFQKIKVDVEDTFQQELLRRFGTVFDRWFSERDLYIPDENGQSAVDRALAVMNERGYIYEAEDATWFRSTDFGDDKDRVLIKANGELTYFTSDMAYHYDKVCRGFDRLINIWGADHHGYIKRCEAMMEAWGHPGMLEVVLGQLVNLLRNGEPVRMSKRTGEMVTFEELVDEVGVDATRFLMLSRSSDQPVDFDIEVAKKQDASNPVYYVQYAHARICSILRKAAGDDQASADELAARVIPAELDLSVLTHESELALMRKMDDFTEFVALAARDRAPFRFTHYAQELAGLFHQFYTNCHIIGEEESLKNARLALADATRILLALTLSLLGVSAPERM